MNAKQMIAKLDGYGGIIPFNSEELEVTLRALRLLAAAERGEGTPETDACADWNARCERIGDNEIITHGLMLALAHDEGDELRLLARRLERERNALAARVRELEPDAERYATMRRAILNDFNGLKFLQYMHWPLDTFDAAGGFDAAIDAARSAP